MTRNRVRIVQDRLRSAAEKVKWVEPANLHFTLRFVGDTPERDVEAVARAAEGLGEWPLRLVLRGVGAFPSPRRARVVWIGLSEGAEALGEVCRALNGRLEATSGLPPEPREFAPHLTIGRVKVPVPSGALADRIEELRHEDFGEFAAEGFALYHSTLTPRGPVYRVVRTYGVPNAPPTRPWMANHESQ